MRLIQLELNNIKSYQQETIKFNDGINCILGANGSGKSTIIESIGSVLFNYNQRSANNLLRYNEVKGSISLLFEGNDNKLYQIIKKYRNKGAGSIKIIDVENDQVLHETVSDVYEFVKRVLNIPKEKSLSKMFEEIIAVPQGTFVNAFLETSRNRKENFDKLFELDIYKSLSDQVKLLCDKIQKEYIRDIENQLFELKGKLANYDSKMDQIKQITEKNIEINNQIKTIDNIYNKKISEKKALEETSNTINEYYNNKKEIEIKISYNNEQLKSLTESLNNSIEAAKKVLENEFGYNLYIKTNNELKVNENKYERYITLNTKISDNTAEIKKLEEANKYLDQILHDLKVQLGINRQLIIDKQKENESKKIVMLSNEKDLIELRKDIKSVEEKNTNIKASVTYQIQRLNSIMEYLLSYNKTSNTILIDEKLLEIDRQLLLINNNKNIIHDLEKKKIKISSDIEYLKTNHQYMSDGKCPILKQKCLNIKGSDLTDEISKLLMEKDIEINNVNSQINLLTQDIYKEDELLKEKNILSVNKLNYDKDYEKYLLTLQELKELFPNDIDNINEENDIDIVKKLIKEYQNKLDNFKDDQLNELKTNEINISNNVISIKTQLTINESLIKEADNKINNLIVDIENKENELNKNKFDIEKRINENKNSEDILYEYKDVKKTIDEQKEILEKHRNNYEIYISKKEEANNQEKYKLSIKQIQDELDINSKKIREIDLYINELEKTFSKKQYDELVDEIDKISKELVTYSTTIEINKKALKELNDEIILLNIFIKEQEQCELKLNSYNELLKKYEIIRKVFINLPRELSEHIRKYISTYSSALYRRISKENVRIDILDDYEVILIDCSDEKKIKTLSQLSGGEQMSVAISIRLAMLKQTSNMDFYFMDEPTINLDIDRRMMVAEVVKDISNELKQLYVISHDDTFESITDNTIKIIKSNNVSVLDN